MISLFDRCMKVVFKHEGGYVNHPDDPGGETKYGIAKKYFPNEDIPNLTKARAKELYYRYYWLPMNLDGIEDETAVLQIYDMGVNAGKHRAIRMAQRLAGVHEDGLCGPITRRAINNYKGDFATHYACERRNYYRDLADRKPALKVFLKGWLNRVDTTKF